MLFVGGWILQLVGHVFEGRKPALADNLFQIFVAPIFLCAELFFALRLQAEAARRRAGARGGCGPRADKNLTQASSSRSPEEEDMKGLLALSRAIDWLNEHVGRLMYWLVLAMVLISAGNAIVRYALNMSSNAWLEIQWYLFSAVFLLLRRLHAAAQRARAHRHRHRAAFARARRAWIDIFGTLFFLLPMAIYHHVAVVAGLRRTPGRSGEVSTNAGGLIRLAGAPDGAGRLLPALLQGISELIKRIAFLRGLIPDPVEKHDGPGARGAARRGSAQGARRTT